VSIVKKYFFSVSTYVVGSQDEEEVEIEFDGNETEEEINKKVEENYRDWMFDRLDGYWKEIK
jgi:hypothetical protein